MISVFEILREASARTSAVLGRDARYDPHTTALVQTLVDHVNAEIASVMALVAPGSSLDAQIAEREADRAELAKLEADERRDAIALYVDPGFSATTITLARPGLPDRTEEITAFDETLTTIRAIAARLTPLRIYIRPRAAGFALYDRLRDLCAAHAPGVTVELSDDRRDTAEAITALASAFD